MKIKGAITIMGMAAALLAAPAARADVAYGSFLFTGLDENGNPIENGTYVMVMDLNQNGYQGLDYLAQSTTQDNSSGWLWDPQDLILDIGAFSGGQAFPFKNIPTPDLPADYTPNQDPYYIAWFNTPYNSQAGPGMGVHYGIELLGAAGADPGNYTSFPNGGPASLLTTSTTVVPEPVSTLLAMLGGGAMFVRRRFF